MLLVGAIVRALLPDANGTRSYTGMVRSMVVFQLAKINTVLKNRPVAKELREEIKKKLDDGERVILDFSRVAGISRGFAEELIGKLTEELGVTVFSRKISLDNVSSRVARVLERVLLPYTEEV